MVHSPLSCSSLSVYTIRQVEVSSPSAESENTLCTSAILASTMCTKIITAATNSATSAITSSSAAVNSTNPECRADDSGSNNNSHQHGMESQINGKFKGHVLRSRSFIIVESSETLVTSVVLKRSVFFFYSLKYTHILCVIHKLLTHIQSRSPLTRLSLIVLAPEVISSVLCGVYLCTATTCVGCI